MAHHVIEYAAALKFTFPEPRHMRPAVLFRGTGEERPSGSRRSAFPNDFLAPDKAGLKNLYEYPPYEL